MYYNGRYYATNNLHEASIRHAMETAQPQNRAQEISITLVRWLFALPFFAILVFMAGVMAYFGAHILFGVG